MTHIKDQLWRDVFGAVKMTFDHHPEYLTAETVKYKDQIINSITKRVVGQVRSSQKGEPSSDGCLSADKARHCL